jgi:hypothetical protein
MYKVESGELRLRHTQDNYILQFIWRYSMTTRKQMQIRRDKEAYKARYDFWIKFDFQMRYASFKLLEESEKDNIEKSVEHQVLFEVTH